jgi:hypothetical protein
MAQLINWGTGDVRHDLQRYAQKLDELDRLLNDPDVPMQPALIWRLLDESIGTKQPHTEGLPTSEDPSAGPP